MQISKTLIILSFTTMLTACASSSQTQTEGGSGGYKMHTHALPAAQGDIKHSHKPPNGPSHSHTMSEVKGLLAQ